MEWGKKNVRECVEEMMSFRYKDFRCRCHLYYKKLGGGEVARQCPYKEFVNRHDDWLWLCDHFDSEAFQVIQFVISLILW